MPYTIFEDEQKLSRSFPTKQDALRKADQAGLVEVDSQGKPVLEDSLSIKRCLPDLEAGSDADLDWSLEKEAT
jgi:hypothetical protein